MSYKDRYEEWLFSDSICNEVKSELRNIKDEEEIEDRFYKELDFGTGGLRGLIGAGTNRINIYTVGKATQGFSNYINSKFKENKAVAIAYDSRNMSKEFAKAAALNLCGNNIKVYLFESLRPTPMLSYAVRKLKCSGGIVITASHNPSKYNGYKVYGKDGAQVTDVPAKEIIEFVNNIKDYSLIKTMDENKALENGMLEYIGEEIDKQYIEDVKSLSIRKGLIKEKANNLKIIYTPIHGTGNIPVRRVLKELGYENLYVVKEQEKPDGNFPTTPYPNPENPQVFEIALDMAKSISPDIIFGTDPDCDRIGVIVKNNEGNYKVLTGNETGILLTNYILKSLSETNTLPKNGVIIKTIVTTELVKKIADYHNIEVLDVLTGFKYIGEKIEEFNKNNNKKYVFGFEESYGYLAGEYSRDKDAVVAAMLIAEMSLYYKEKNMSLYDGLMEIYNEFGCSKETLKSIELKGKEGQEKIANCIDEFRNNIIDSINNIKVVKKYDYKLSIEEDYINSDKLNIDLPKSNVLKYVLEDGSWFVIRPSGTEPKMKIYMSVTEENLIKTNKKMQVFSENIMQLVNSMIK